MIAEALVGMPLRVIPGGSCARLPGVVAHAGLGINHAGGAPDEHSLETALRSRVTAIELDVCVTEDEAIVLHHDRTTPTGVPITEISLARLQREYPVLQLDEAIEIVSDEVPLILDVKVDAAVKPLIRARQQAGEHQPFAYCSERQVVLRELAAATPRLPLWHSFPDVGSRRHERVVRVASGLLAHRGMSAVRLAGDLRMAVGRVTDSPRDALAYVTGLPWRNLLPTLLPTVREEFAARGVSVHHSLVTEELCAAAHGLDMTVITWTVNTAPAARRVADCGVDLITTDHVAEIAEAVEMQADLRLIT